MLIQMMLEIDESNRGKLGELVYIAEAGHQEAFSQGAHVKDQ